MRNLENETTEQSLNGVTSHNPTTEDLLRRLNYQPHGLRNSELEKPILGIADFFGYFSLATTRANILDFYKAWIYFNADCANEELTRNMLLFFSQLDKLVTVSYVAAYNDKSNPFWVGYMDYTSGEELTL